MGHIGKSVLIADKLEETITIRDILENGVRTLSIEENGKIYYQQSTAFECIPNGAKTFLDEFLDRLSSCCDKPDESKRLNDVGDVGDNGADFFYLISKARLQSLNLKQKFFHFLLKKVFFHGKAPSTENIRSLCMHNHIE